MGKYLTSQRIIIAVAVGGIVFAFNACGKFQTLGSGSSDMPSTSLSVDGYKLYAVNCASCHQSIEASSIRDRNLSPKIVSLAIMTNSTMKVIPSLSQLTDTEIQAITDVLNRPVDVAPQSVAVVFQQPLGDRNFIASKMKSLFSRGNTALNTTIDMYSTDLGRVFGGVCNRTMPNCRGNEAQTIEVQGVATGNVLRNGYRIKACEAVLENDIAVTTFLTQLNLNAQSPRSKQNLSAVIDAITNVGTPDILLEKFQKIDAVPGISGMDSWRMALLTLCKSSLFENF